jgi:Cu/Ag efflux pump CusA
MARLKQRIAEDMPELNTYFQSGGMVDAVLNLGLPAPIDVQVAGSNLELSHRTAQNLATEIQRIPGVADVYIPQDIDYPALKLDVDRTRASELGLDQQEVVGNIITALTSNQMIARIIRSIKIRPGLHAHSQYAEDQVKSLADLRGHSPARPG